MRRLLPITVATFLIGCGPSGIGSSGDEAASSSEGEDGDGDPATGDGDGDPSTGDGDGEPGDGDGEMGTDAGPLDLPDDCMLVIDGDVALDANTTQAEFDALACVVEITGDLDIEGTSVENLGFLAKLERVGGQLTLLDNEALTDLAGLEALERVGKELRLFSNESLESLSGLISLHELGGLIINVNPSLISVAGLNGALLLLAP